MARTPVPDMLGIPVSSMSKYLCRVLKRGGFLLTSPPPYPHVGQHPESFPPQGAGGVRDLTEGLVAGGPLWLPPPLPSGHLACVRATSLQLSPTLCDPMGHSSPGSSVMGFSKHEWRILHWSGGLPRPPPGALSDLGIELASLMSPARASEFFPASATWEALRAPHPSPKLA